MISAPAIHNTSSRNDILNREYRNYNDRWKENAYMPKPKDKQRGNNASVSPVGRHKGK
jgi:hypothetical protein